MWTVRNADQRGRAKIDWLDSKHTFSFGDYWDPSHMGFGALRVINEDRIQPGAGFPRHPHRDMEILSYVLEGALEHKDSMGTGSVIRPGELQYMSAGSGVTHSEFNAAPDATTHFYQLWIVPNVQGVPPRYAQIRIDETSRENRFSVLAGGADFNAPIELRQDAALSSAKVAPNTQLVHALRPERQYWLQVARGSLSAQAGEHDTLPHVHLSAGDGLAMTNLDRVTLRTESPAELLLFDLPRSEALLIPFTRTPPLGSSR